MTAFMTPTTTADPLMNVMRVVTEYQQRTNARRHSFQPPQAPIFINGVQLSGQGQLKFSLQQEERQEVFCTDGQHIAGRGGLFTVNDDSEIARLFATVRRTTPVTESLLNLRERLLERGFTLEAAPEHAYTASFILRPLMARHPGGAVLWLAVYTENQDNADCYSICGAPGWLACYENPAGKDALDELARPEGPLNESLTPNVYFVSGEALDALIHALDGRCALSAALPHTVPPDFFKRSHEFRHEPWSVSRRSLLERRARRPHVRLGSDLSF